MSASLPGGPNGDIISSPSTGWQAPPRGKWRENPERLAWFVLLASFAIFCFLAVAVPLGVNYVIRYATVSETARLEPTLGTLLLYTSNGGQPIAVTTPRNDVGEGSRIVGQADAVQGTLGLVSTENPGAMEVLGSVQVYANTNLRLERIRRPFFPRSREPYQVRLRLESGQVSVFTNSGDQRPLRVEVETPHGLINLGAGSYWIMVDDAQTDVTVRNGVATLSQEQNNNLVVGANLRGSMNKEGLAKEAVSAEQNLILNGNFAQPPLESWPSYLIADNVEPGTVQFTEREGRSVAYFIRQGEENVHNEVGIKQMINRDVNVYDSLTLQLDVNILFQSLSGAGFVNTEFPLRVELNYTDIYGKDLTWGYGFYYRDPEGSSPAVPETLGQQIAQAQWFTYRSPDLIDLLMAEGTRPARINSIRIYASGWNYRSMVSEVYLIAQ
ncbi:MAG TPA: hypothetical protein PKE45_12180 [Caldilineaceae bacterium]|nr:hypothetical protein [Caldilineaceae bacterium]